MSGEHGSNQGKDEPSTKAARVKPFDGPSADEATGPVPPGVDDKGPAEAERPRETD